MPVTRFVLTALLATGCGTSIGVTPINASPRPLRPRPPAAVEVFLTQAPSRPYVDVAYLEAEQESELSGDAVPAFLDKLRYRAAQIGCDGLIVGEHTSRETVSLSDVTTDVVDAVSKEPVDKPASYGQPVSLRGLTATCIVYRPTPDELAAAARSEDDATSRVHTAIEICRQQRIEIMQRAARIKDLSERGRMYRTMPTCGVRPAS